MRPENSVEGHETWNVWNTFDFDERMVLRKWDHRILSKVMRPEMCETHLPCTRDGVQEHEARTSSKVARPEMCGAHLTVTRESCKDHEARESSWRSWDLKCVKQIWLVREKDLTTMRPENILKGHETWNVWSTRPWGRRILSKVKGPEMCWKYLTHLLMC